MPQKFVLKQAIVLIILGTPIVVTFATFVTKFPKVNFWLVGSTKINSLQSMFQLGVATSAAFIVAGPHIRHALGPKIKEAIIYARQKAAEVNGPIQELANFARTLSKYDKYKQNDTDYLRRNLYLPYLCVMLLNYIMLFWSSSIDPNGKMLNPIALLITLACMILPLFDLAFTYNDSLGIRRILQRAKIACDSGKPEEIIAVCAVLESEMKLLLQ